MNRYVNNKKNTSKNEGCINPIFSKEFLGTYTIYWFCKIVTCSVW